MELFYNLSPSNQLIIKDIPLNDGEAYQLDWINTETDKSGYWRIDRVGNSDTYILKSGDLLLASEFICCGSLAECINYVVDYHKLKDKQAKRSEANTDI